MSKPESSKRNRTILNVAAGIGIVGGIVAQRLFDITGIIPGALFGAGGAFVGMMIGGVIVSILQSDK